MCSDPILVDMSSISISITAGRKIVMPCNIMRGWSDNCKLSEFGENILQSEATVILKYKIFICMKAEIGKRSDQFDITSSFNACVHLVSVKKTGPA